MKKLSVTIMALLFMTAISSPADAASVLLGKKRSKAAQQYDVANVNDYLEVYNPGEKIAIYVEGKSPVEIAPEPKSGFNVHASITNNTLNKTIDTAIGTYDEDKRAWLITFKAPGDYKYSYSLHVYFFCEKENSPCDNVYGRYLHVTKSLPLQVR